MKHSGQVRRLRPIRRENAAAVNAPAAEKFRAQRNLFSFCAMVVDDITQDRGSRVSFVTEDDTGDDKLMRPHRMRGHRKDPLGPDGEIGSRLRALYSEVEREPIPMQLIDLLEQLSEAERKAGK